MLIDLDVFDQDVFSSPTPAHYTDSFTPESMREKSIVAITPLSAKTPQNLNSSIKFSSNDFPSSGADVFSRLTLKKEPTGYTGIAPLKTKTSSESNDCLKLQHTLIGHDGFVFHLEALNNHLFSASQDMVNNELVFTILIFFAESEAMGYLNSPRSSRFFRTSESSSSCQTL
jgi:hypothetical protein